MHRFTHRAIQGALAGLVCFSGPVLATNGYFAHGYGTKSSGMAGAGVALPQDAMAAATNPAGMVWVGNRMDFGVALFSPDRSYSTSGTPSGACASPTQCTFGIGPQSISSDNDLFLVPHFARNWSIDSNSSFGIAVYGNGGMNTEYKGGTATYGGPPGIPPGTSYTTPGTYGAGTTGVDLMQLFFTPTYSKKISETSSWGASAIIAAQRFKADGLANFGPYSSDSSNLSNKGADTSYGAGLRLGWQGEVSQGVTLGASYTTKIAMSEFDKYKGLFAEQGDFDIPATATVGIAWKTSPSSILTFDVQEIWYSKVKSIANPMMPNLGSSQLGNDDGAGFGWRDMTVYKLGYQWQTSPQWTWRAGISQTEQPIPSSEVMFNILAPGVQETHVTAGFTFAKTQDSEINFAVMYSPESKVSGSNPLDPAQTIELKMDQWQIEASWGWKF